MISVFESADRAQEAIGKIERGGFDMSKLSIIGKEEPSAAHQLGFAVAGAHASAWGQHSALWNRLAEAPGGDGAGVGAVHRSHHGRRPRGLRPGWPQLAVTSQSAHLRARRLLNGAASLTGR